MTRSTQESAGEGILNAPFPSSPELSKDGQRHTVAAGGPPSPPGGPPGPPPIDIHALLQEYNASNVERGRAYRLIDAASHKIEANKTEAEQLKNAAGVAATSHGVIQGRHPEWNQSLPLECLGLIVIAAVDALASYFAAEDLGESQIATLMFTRLFLAALIGGVIFLAGFHRHKQPKRWKALAVALAAFILFLGYLRYDYLDTTSSARYPLVGAIILTAITAGALIAGYLAWRRRESLEIFKARYRAEQAARKAKQAAEEVAKARAERDSLVGAYLSDMALLIQDKAVESRTNPAKIKGDIREFLCPNT